MPAEAWIGVAALIVTLLGSLAGAAFWAHRVYTLQVKQLTQFENFNDNFNEFRSDNKEEHEQIWSQVKSQNDEIGRTKEKVSRIEGKILG